MYRKYQKLIRQGSMDGVNWFNIEPNEFKKGDVISEDASECGGSGTSEEEKYQWVAVPNQYRCLNNNKYALMKKQVLDKETMTWKDVIPYETTLGDIIERNSEDCGYGIEWIDTESWQCASVPNTYTTKIEVFNSGTVNYEYGGQQGTIPKAMWLDTVEGQIKLQAIPINDRMPFSRWIIDGNTNTNSNITLNANSDHIVSAYFKNYICSITYRENERYIISPKTQPLWVESGNSVEILASSYAQGYGVTFPFAYWRLGTSLIDGEPQVYSSIRTNPAIFTVSEDCVLDLYYANEAMISGYYLTMNGQRTGLIEQGGGQLMELGWYNAFPSTWFIENDLQRIEQYISDHNDLYFVGSNCFYGSHSSACAHLTTISLPLVEGVGQRAFMALSWLRNVSLPECRSIHAQAFQGCDALTILSFPKLSLISASAFMNCKNLTTLYLLGSSVVELDGRSQFYGCANMKSVIVPQSLYTQYKTAWLNYSYLIKSY